MGLFDFLRLTPSPLSEYYDKPFRFAMRDMDSKEFSMCKAGDSVNFWSKPHLPEVSIYTPKTHGGGAIGYVPSKYRGIIRDHILARKPYRAIIIDESGIVEFSLTSDEARVKFEGENIERFRDKVAKSLNRKYNGLKSPILVKFHITGEGNFEQLHLKLMDKEYYLKNPTEVKLELMDDLGKVVAEARAPMSMVLNVLKAHCDGRKLTVSNISIAASILHATISAEGTPPHEAAL